MAVPAESGTRQGDFVGGKYLLEECLGIGGMGEVYRATNVSLGRKVAIKLLSKEHTKNEDDVLRFLREARAAAAVRHPNVVDVFDVARDDDGTPFIVQELLSGEDLEQYMGRTRTGRLPAREALEIMSAVAEAVGAAHARDVVHRDLKPANIYLAREGKRIVPKVLDFGACLYQTVGGLSAKERRMLIGTPHYMAPEQITTAQEVDARADVWAVGVILYELLVGETPFEAEDGGAVMKQVRARKVPPLRELVPELPESLERVVSRCMERERAKRYPDAGALRDALELVRTELGNGSPSEARTVTAPATHPFSLASETARAPERHRLPSLVMPGGKANVLRRRASVLTLADPGEGSDPNEAPASSARPIPAAPPARTAADVLHEADLAAAARGGSIAPSLMLPPSATSSSPFSLSLPPTSLRSTPSSEPGAPRDLDLDEEQEAPLDLDLAPGRGGYTAGPSSMPPVLDPRAASGGGRSSERGNLDLDLRASSRPPPFSRTSSHPGARAPGEELRASSPTAPLARPSARPPFAARSPERAEVWPLTAKLTFVLGGVLPGVIAFLAVRAAPSLTAPLGHAMRGGSPLASGILTVLALVGAAALAAATLGPARSRGLVMATVGCVLLGMVMIIVTFSASEAAELEMVPAAAGLVPFVAPIIPLGLGLAALGRARAGWLSHFERRDALGFLAVASFMLFAALELGPFGAFHLRGAAGVTPTGATSAPARP